MMRKLRTVVLAGAAALLCAGVAVAATTEFHSISVNLPDGGIAHIEYAGDVAPRVAIAPAAARDAADSMFAMDPDFARISAMMARQQQEMMRQVAALRNQAAAGAQGQAGQFVVTGNMPAGSSYQYTMVSSSSGNGSCTQSIEWRSDGANKQPQVTRASSGDCGAVQGGEGSKPVPASAGQQAAVADGRTI
jgi:hypothetical protein